MEEYRSLKELYEALKPAFSVKIRMFKNSEYSYLTSIDIWNYLKDNVWVSSVNLTIADMVSNIINVDGVKIDRYLKNKRSVGEIDG